MIRAGRDRDRGSGALRRALRGRRVPVPAAVRLGAAIVEAGGLMPMLEADPGDGPAGRNLQVEEVAMTTICLIPGDGVGQEVIPAAARVLAAVRPDLSFIQAEAGWECFRAPRHRAARRDGRGRRRGRRHAVRRDPVAQRRSSRATAARSWRCASSSTCTPTCARPRLLPGQPAVDLLIVRENTEGLYSGRERREGDTAIAERVITRAASERIARVAFEQARSAASAAPAAHSPVASSTSRSVYHRPQGQRPEAHRWPVPRVLPGGGARVPRRGRRRDAGRCRRDVAGQGPGAAST